MHGALALLISEIFFSQTHPFSCFCEDLVGAGVAKNPGRKLGVFAQEWSSVANARGPKISRISHSLFSTEIISDRSRNWFNGL